MIYAAIAAPTAIAVLFGSLWLSSLRAQHRAEQERDQMWDEVHREALQ